MNSFARVHGIRGFASSLANEALSNENREKFGKAFQKMVNINADDRLKEIVSEKGLFIAACPVFDMAYITPRLVALGRPSIKPSSREENRNNAQQLGEYFLHQHSGRFLLWNLSGQKLEPEESRKLSNQIINPAWETSGATHIPNVDDVLRICYAIQAWYEIDEGTAVAGIFCSRGLTRTSLLIACYLRYSNRVKTSMEGFELFYKKRINQDICQINSLLSSMITFFLNFDVAVDLLHFPNTKPLCLVGIATVGIPSKDLPVLEVWNRNNKKYSSVEADQENVQWVNHEGYYKIQQALHGDFMILCRFSGKSRAGKLFRYINSTFFLQEGVLELQKQNVDVTATQECTLDDAAFKIVLMFSFVQTEKMASMPAAGTDFEILSPFSLGATRQGIIEICAYHTINPELQLLDLLLEKGYPSEAATLALQLSCNELEEALNFLSMLMTLLLSIERKRNGALNCSTSEPTFSLSHSSKQFEFEASRNNSLPRSSEFTIEIQHSEGEKSSEITQTETFSLLLPERKEMGAIKNPLLDLSVCSLSHSSKQIEVEATPNNIPPQINECIMYPNPEVEKSPHEPLKTKIVSLMSVERKEYGTINYPCSDPSVFPPSHSPQEFAVEESLNNNHLQSSEFPINIQLPEAENSSAKLMKPEKVALNSSPKISVQTCKTNTECQENEEVPPGFEDIESWFNNLVGTCPPNDNLPGMCPPSDQNHEENVITEEMSRIVEENKKEQQKLKFAIEMEEARQREVVRAKLIAKRERRKHSQSAQFVVCTPVNNSPLEIEIRDINLPSTEISIDSFQNLLPRNSF